MISVQVSCYLVYYFLLISESNLSVLFIQFSSFLSIANFHFIHKNDFDRTILMYSYNGNLKYNFSISGLGDNDRWFDIIMSNYSNINAKGWFYNDSSNISLMN